MRKVFLSAAALIAVAPIVGASRVIAASQGYTNVTGLSVQAAVCDPTMSTCGAFTSNPQDGPAIAATWTAPQSAPALSYTVSAVTTSGTVVQKATTPDVSATVGGLTSGTTYQLSVTPHFATGSGPATLSVPVTVLAPSVPASPRSASLTQLGSGNDLLVKWAPASTGDLATGAVVVLFTDDGGNPAYVTQLSCQAGCTSLTFRNQAYGHDYLAGVYPTNAAGSYWVPALSPVFDLTTSCPTAACVSVDAATTSGPVTHRAAGFLGAIFPTSSWDHDVSLAEALQMKQYRGAPNWTAGQSQSWRCPTNARLGSSQPTPGALDYGTSWMPAQSTGAQMTLMLSSIWLSQTSVANGGTTITPWSNWNCYQAWVYNTVKTVEASGAKVTYWDIQNEPGGPEPTAGSGFYSPSDWTAMTSTDVLDQYLYAYRAIIAADPKAQIIGPSDENFEDYASEYTYAGGQSKTPDLTTFLDFAADNGIKLGAVSWHEIDTDLGPNPTETGTYAQDVIDHVAEARRMISARPAVGTPKIIINEYGAPTTSMEPGWNVAYLAALELAGVDGASQSCWNPVICDNPTLDGLLYWDGTTLTPSGVVYSQYADMSGNMVPTSSSVETVSSMASYDGSTVRVLLGRGDGCLSGTDPACPTTTPIPAPEAVTVQVSVPWTGSAQVSLTDIGPSYGADSAETPAPVSNPAVSTQAVTGGSVSITIPAFADGDAYALALTPAS